MTATIDSHLEAYALADARSAQRPRRHELERRRRAARSAPRRARSRRDQRPGRRRVDPLRGPPLPSARPRSMRTTASLATGGISSGPTAPSRSAASTSSSSTTRASCCASSASSAHSMPLDGETQSVEAGRSTAIGRARRAVGRGRSGRGARPWCATPSGRTCAPSRHGHRRGPRPTRAGRSCS